MNTITDKILFLDIDGVLVSTENWTDGDNRARAASESTNITYNPQLVGEHTRFDAEAVQGVQEVLLAHQGTKIVVISDWVGNMGVERTMAALLRNGFGPEDFHPEWNLHLTKYASVQGTRWQKIVQENEDYRSSRPAMWLSLHPEVKHYVVLDDKQIGRRLLCRPKALGSEELRERSPWILGEQGLNALPDRNWVRVAPTLRSIHVQQAIHTLHQLPDAVHFDPMLAFP